MVAPFVCTAADEPNNAADQYAKAGAGERRGWPREADELLARAVLAGGEACDGANHRSDPPGLLGALPPAAAAAHLQPMDEY